MDELINSGWHHTYGWLRRSEMDENGTYCYEEPDGDLVYSMDPRHKIRAHLNHWRDKKTGEHYLAFSKIPISVSNGSIARFLKPSSGS